jgi:hypothetical protein
VHFKIAYNITDGNKKKEKRNASHGNFPLTQIVIHLETSCRSKPNLDNMKIEYIKIKY